MSRALPSVRLDWRRRRGPVSCRWWCAAFVDRRLHEVPPAPDAVTGLHVRVEQRDARVHPATESARGGAAVHLEVRLVREQVPVGAVALGAPPAARHRRRRRRRRCGQTDSSGQRGSGGGAGPLAAAAAAGSAGAARRGCRRRRSGAGSVPWSTLRCRLRWLRRRNTMSQWGQRVLPACMSMCMR